MQNFLIDFVEQMRGGQVLEYKKINRHDLNFQTILVCFFAMSLTTYFHSSLCVFVSGSSMIHLQFTLRMKFVTSGEFDVESLLGLKHLAPFRPCKKNMFTNTGTEKYVFTRLPNHVLARRWKKKSVHKLFVHTVSYIVTRGLFYGKQLVSIDLVRKLR